MTGMLGCGCAVVIAMFITAVITALIMAGGVFAGIGVCILFVIVCFALLALAAAGAD